MRVGEITYESQKTNRVYAAICEGCRMRGRIGSDFNTGTIFNSDQRLRWKCGKLMDVARCWTVGSGNDEVLRYDHECWLG